MLLSLVYPQGMGSGQHTLMMWIIGALVMIQLRPGGMFADIAMPDGRLARELLGYPRTPADVPRKQSRGTDRTVVAR